MSNVVITIDDSDDNEPELSSDRYCTVSTKKMDGERLDGMSRKGSDASEAPSFTAEDIGIQAESSIQPNSISHAVDKSDQDSTSGTEILDASDEAVDFELPPEPTTDEFDDQGCSDEFQPLAKRAA